MGKKALAGGENTPGQKIKETKEKKHSNLTHQNFFLFFSRGIFTPSSGKNSPSLGYKYPSLWTFIFFCSTKFPWPSVGGAKGGPRPFEPKVTENGPFWTVSRGAGPNQARSLRAPSADEKARRIFFWFSLFL
jgi:hypothetical protein